MFTLTSNLDDCTRRLDALISRQLPFATSRALNDTAEAVRKAEIVEMRQVFDRPVPYTLNAFQIGRATKDNLVATVERKEHAGGRHYLEVQQRGGLRPKTAFESSIYYHWPGPASWENLIPGAGAALDQYGNWSKGQMTAVMAALGAMRDTASNQTKTSRATVKANRARARYYKLLGMKVPENAVAFAAWKGKVAKADLGGRKYFVPREGSALKPAIYARDSGGQLAVILALTAKEAFYKPIFKFEATAQQAAREAFPALLATRLAEAVATAR